MGGGRSGPGTSHSCSSPSPRSVSAACSSRASTPLRAVATDTESALILIGGAAFTLCSAFCWISWLGPLDGITVDEQLAPAAGVRLPRLRRRRSFFLGSTGVGAALMAVQASLAAMKAGLPSWLGWPGVAAGLLSAATIVFFGIFGWMAWIAVASHPVARRAARLERGAQEPEQVAACHGADVGGSQPARLEPLDERRVVLRARPALRCPSPARHRAVCEPVLRLGRRWHCLPEPACEVAAQTDAVDAHHRRQRAPAGRRRRLSCAARPDRVRMEHQAEQAARLGQRPQLVVVEVSGRARTRLGSRRGSR